MIGDLILIKNNNFLSWVIRKITHGKFNHIGVFVSEKMIVEAKMTGVTITPLRYFKRLKKENKLDYGFYRIKDLTSDKTQKLCEFAIDQVGRKYDFKQLIGLAFSLLLQCTNKKNPLDAEKAFICSELIGEACKAVGIVLDSNVDVSNLTPTNIVNSSLVYKV